MLSIPAWFDWRRSYLWPQKRRSQAFQSQLGSIGAVGPQAAAVPRDAFNPSLVRLARQGSASSPRLPNAFQSQLGSIGAMTSGATRRPP